MNFPAGDQLAPLPMGVVRVIVLYVALASLWFGLYDASVAGLAFEPAQRALVHTLKVWIFVGASAALWGAWLVARERQERRLKPAGTGERRYRLLFDSNPQPMWVFDLQTLRFLAVNDAAIEHYGYSREEFLAMSITEIRPAEELARMQRKLAELASEPSRVLRQDGTWLHCVKGGRQIEVEISTNEVVFGGQRARLVLAQDVTQQRETERQRQAAHDVLRDVLTRVDVGFVALDRDWRCTYLNQQAAHMLGRAKPEELIGRHIWTEYPESVGQPFHRAYEKAMATQQPLVFEDHYAPWDRWFENRIYPSAQGLSIYFTDITVRKQSEQALRLSETRFRLAASHGQVWDWDMVTGRSTVPAPFWKELGHECPAPEQIRECFVALVHPEDLPCWRVAVRAHLVQRLPYDFEFRARHANGQWRWFHTRGLAIWDATGRATYMAGTTFDITARHAAQTALRTSQRELSELTHRLLAQETTTTRRLAQALHDHLGQTLAVARLNLDACMAIHSAAMPSAMKEQGHQIGLLLDQAVREVRQVLVDLRPPLLEDQGLTAALQNEIGTRAVAGGSVDVLLEVADEALGRRWPADVEYGAFMVAREAIANAQQHARASLIRVLLSGDDGSLRLDVIDDGCGIPAPLVRGRPGHLGIVGMRERALAIGASVDVSAVLAGGTQATLRWQAGQA
jgi:PAS domain S-box-containing protein